MNAILDRLTFSQDVSTGTGYIETNGLVLGAQIVVSHDETLVGI